MTYPTKDYLKKIPKAELHLHLEGTLEPELKLKLATKNNIDIGQTTIQEIKTSYQFDSLTSFLNVYYPAMNVLQTKQDFYDLASAYFEKAKENNVVYCELFFDPQAHTSRGVAFKEIMEGYHAACMDAKKIGIQAQLIMCFLRDFSAESAMETYEQMLPYKDKIIGVGLDSDERENPPLKFQDVFHRAKQDGLHITMHCDIDQVNSIGNIRDALHTIQVERIDHGTNIVEDPKLVQYAIDHKIGFTCCPVSNSFVTSKMKGAEMLELLHKGAKVTINSDDPAYFQSYITNDLFELAKAYDVNKEDCIALIKNAFEIAWISDVEKSAYITMVDEVIA